MYSGHPLHFGRANPCRWVIRRLIAHVYTHALSVTISISNATNFNSASIPLPVIRVTTKPLCGVYLFGILASTGSNPRTGFSIELNLSLTLDYEGPSPVASAGAFQSKK